MPHSTKAPHTGHMSMDVSTKVRLSANTGSEPNLLIELASDADAAVRTAVAMNTSTPIEIDRLLALDSHVEVRAMLASKLARKLVGMVPDLRGADRGQPQHPMFHILNRLAADDAVPVRAAISEAVKSTAQAPHKLILQLAHDDADAVSCPVIRQSPLLTNEDLLKLLSAPPNRPAIAAVAGRDRLPEVVSDAVACAADAAAISELLANHTAAIRRSTLEALAAAQRPDWTELLAARPGGMQASLSEFLTGRPPPRQPTIDEAMWAARELANRGELDEKALYGAARRGETRMATAMLAVAANVSAAMVERAIELRDVKALVSLVWRAEFSMRLAVPLQILLTRTPRESLLLACRNGNFPLAEEDMCWRLALLKSMAR